jgi:hypothetical protein
MTLGHRRSFAAVTLATALLAAACSGGKAGPSRGDRDSIVALKSGATEVSLISTESPVKPGKTYFGFDLITSQGGVITGGSPQVWLGKDASSKPTGPFGATWYPFTPASEFNDSSPRSALPGTYAAELDIPSVGHWIVLATIDSRGKLTAGTAALTATAASIPAEIGTKALSTKTPVAHSEAEARQICTRDPPDPLHYISLDKALTNGKPTAVAFATPALCESMLCGPVVDELLKAFQMVGKSKANFIHVEEFLPGPDLKPPPATLENASPAFKAWGFTTEPWVIVIDEDGIIRARYEGPVTAPQIAAALQPLL